MLVETGNQSHFDSAYERSVSFVTHEDAYAFLCLLPFL